jgi:hypothetical protein
MEQYIVTDDRHTPLHVPTLEQAMLLVALGLTLGKTVVISRVVVPHGH